MLEKKIKKAIAASLLVLPLLEIGAWTKFPRTQESIYRLYHPRAVIFRYWHEKEGSRYFDKEVFKNPIHGMIEFYQDAKIRFFYIKLLELADE